MKVESLRSQYKRHRIMMELQFYEGGDKILKLLNNVVIIEERI